MKNCILIILILVLVSRMNGQPLPDSIITKYNSGKSNEEKERILNGV